MNKTKAKGPKRKRTPGERLLNPARELAQESMMLLAEAAEKRNASDSTDLLVLAVAAMADGLATHKKAIIRNLFTAAQLIHMGEQPLQQIALAKRRAATAEEELKEIREQIAMVDDRMEAEERRRRSAEAVVSEIVRMNVGVHAEETSDLVSLARGHHGKFAHGGDRDEQGIPSVRLDAVRRVDELLDLLRSMEWAGGVCVVCHEDCKQLLQQVHADGCALAAALDSPTEKDQEEGGGDDG